MKQMNALTIAAAVAGALSLAAVTSATPAMAAKVKCYGIAKAGQNDCANKAGTHSCSGQTKANYSGGDWKGVADAAACAAAGGQFEGVQGHEPEKEIRLTPA